MIRLKLLVNARQLLPIMNRLLQNRSLLTVLYRILYKFTDMVLSLLWMILVIRSRLHLPDQMCILPMHPPRTPLGWGGRKRSGSYVVGWY